MFLNTIAFESKLLTITYLFSSILKLISKNIIIETKKSLFSSKESKSKSKSKFDIKFLKIEFSNCC